MNPPNPQEVFKLELKYIKSLIDDSTKRIANWELAKASSKRPDLYEALIESEQDLIAKHRQEMRELLNGKV